MLGDGACSCDGSAGSSAVAAGGSVNSLKSASAAISPLPSNTALGTGTVGGSISIGAGQHAIGPNGAANSGNETVETGTAICTGGKRYVAGSSVFTISPLTGKVAARGNSVSALAAIDAAATPAAMEYHNRFITQPQRENAAGAPSGRIVITVALRTIRKIRIRPT